MFKNYFKTAWRNLMKNKMFSFINLLGLTIGITVCMMIYLFIMNEFSVDRFGVVDDFNFKSLKQDVDALVISPAEDRRQILIKLKPGNPQAGIALVKKLV